jgi:hypothetical protein
MDSFAGTFGRALLKQGFSFNKTVPSGLTTTKSSHLPAPVNLLSFNKTVPSGFWLDNDQKFSFTCTC